MERVESWYNLTVDHTATHGLDTPNRFSISKLLRTPQLYSLPGNKYKGWSTCNDLIESINARIELFNLRKARSSVESASCLWWPACPTSARARQTEAALTPGTSRGRRNPKESCT